MGRSWIFALFVLSTIPGCGSSGQSGGSGGKTINGYASFSLDRNSSGDELEVRAVFYDPAATYSVPPTPPSGKCVEGSIASFPSISGGSMMGVFPKLVLTTPAGPVDIPKDDNPYATYYSGEANGSEQVVTMGGYALAAPEANPPFSLDFQLPAAIDVTAPVNGAIVTSTDDLEITWTSEQTGGPVYVTFDQEKDDNVYTVDIACTFDDTGSGIIPKDMLAGLVAPTQAEIDASGRGYAIHIAAQRQSYELVPVSGLGNLLLLFSVKSQGSANPPPPPTP